MNFACPHCRQKFEIDNDMAGLAQVCPTCGKSFTIPQTSSPPAIAEPQVVRVENSLAGSTKAMPGMAVASLVLGILGLMGSAFCCGMPFALLAVVFGHIAFSKINREPERYTGRGLAIGGLATGYVGLLLGLILGLVFGLFTSILGAMSEAMQAPR